jgi:hypothetical protein
MKTITVMCFCTGIVSVYENVTPITKNENCEFWENWIIRKGFKLNQVSYMIVEANNFELNYN